MAADIDLVNDEVAVFTGDAVLVVIHIIPGVVDKTDLHRVDLGAGGHVKGEVFPFAPGGLCGEGAGAVHRDLTAVDQYLEFRGTGALVLDVLRVVVVAGELDGDRDVAAVDHPQVGHRERIAVHIRGVGQQVLGPDDDAPVLGPGQLDRLRLVNHRRVVDGIQGQGGGGADACRPIADLVVDVHLAVVIGLWGEEEGAVGVGGDGALGRIDGDIGYGEGVRAVDVRGVGQQVGAGENPGAVFSAAGQSDGPGDDRGVVAAGDGDHQVLSGRGGAVVHRDRDGDGYRFTGGEVLVGGIAGIKGPGAVLVEHKSGGLLGVEGEYSAIVCIAGSN